MPDRWGTFVVMDRTGAPGSDPRTHEALVGFVAMWCANVCMCNAIE